MRKKKWYAIKSVDGKIIDLIVTSWEECKEIVYHHKAVYKSFLSVEEAEGYLKEMTEEKQEDYLKQGEYAMKKRKESKAMTKEIKIKVPSEVYDGFIQKLGRLNYRFNDVVIDLMKEWYKED